MVGAFAYAELEAVLEADPGPILILDHLQDPHNFGALVRTAAAAGMAAVVIPRHGAVGVTGAVEKVAAGAVSDVPICQVANLHRTCSSLRELGYWSIGLTPAGGTSLFEVEHPAAPRPGAGRGNRHAFPGRVDLRLGRRSRNGRRLSR